MPFLLECTLYQPLKLCLICRLIQLNPKLLQHRHLIKILRHFVYKLLLIRSNLIQINLKASSLLLHLFICHVSSKRRSFLDESLVSNLFLFLCFLFSNHLQLLGLVFLLLGHGIAEILRLIHESVG